MYCNHIRFGPGTGGEPSRFEAAPGGYWGGLADTGTAYLAAPGEFPPRLLRFHPLWPSGLAIRRPFFVAIGGWDERLAGIRGEDNEFTLRATAAGSVGMLKAPLTRYRWSHGQARISSARQSLGELQVLQFCLAHHKAAAAPSLRSALTAAIRRGLHMCFYESCKSGELDLARRFAAEVRQDGARLAEQLKVLALLLPDGLAGLIFRLWHALSRPAQRWRIRLARRAGRCR